MENSKLSSIIKKHGNGPYCYNIVFNARKCHFRRWKLMIDTAGGYWTVGSFRTKKDLHKERISNWSGRLFTITDEWLSVQPELLADYKKIAKLLKWSKCENIFEAKLS